MALAPKLFVVLGVCFSLSLSSLQCLAWSPFDVLTARFSPEHARGPLTHRTDNLNEPVPAPNCYVLDCPTYAVVHEESDFQVRRYRDSTWVQTETLQDVSFLKATYRGFHSLFEYIEGENENATHIPMTAPVVTSIVPSGGPFCSSAFAVSLFVPPKYSEATPTPKASLNPKVKVKKTEGGACIVVRKFGGFATDFNVAGEAEALANSLKSTPWASIVKSSSGESSYSIAQYNSPFEIAARVNEVWVYVPSSKKHNEDCLPPKDSEGGVSVV